MKNRKPKIGFMVCTSHSDIRNEVGVPFAVQGMAEIAARKLEEKDVEVIRYKKLVDGEVKGWQIDNYDRAAIVDTDVKANEAFDKFYAEDVDCVVMFFTSFAHASIYMQGIRRLKKPIILWTGDDIDGCQALGLFAQRSALDAVGYHYKYIYGIPEKPEIIEQIVRYINACKIKNILGRSKFGQWGSNPMGMFGGLMNDWEWFKKFGIIAEHLECQTIEKESYKIPDEDCRQTYEMLKKRAKKIPPFKDETIRKNIKFYLAHKALVKKLNLDFDGLKCIFELSDGFGCPCIGHSLMWDDCYVSGCTNEPLGSLTMYIMRLISGKGIIFQGDIEQVELDTGIVRMDMTAGAPFDMADEKGFEIKEGPNVGEGDAVDLWPKLRGKKGVITFGRLYWRKDEFVLVIAKGKAVETDEKMVIKNGWPTGPFVTLKLDGDAAKFLDNVRHQYNHFIYEDILEDLVDVCDVLQLKVIVC
jgi:L-fucose isomerase-like protein